MALIQGGVSSSVAGVAVEAALPLHVVGKPDSYGALGHYMATFVTGTIGAGISGNSEILQFRWVPSTSTNLALITLVEIMVFRSLGTGFSAGVGQFDLTIARSFSAAGTGGGTATLTGNNNKLRTSMGTANVSEIRVATTAALGAGTKTLDDNRISYLQFAIDTTADKVFLQSPNGILYRRDAFEQPIVLATSEGFAIRTTMPATGTWSAYMRLGWAEVTAY